MLLIYLFMVYLTTVDKVGIAKTHQTFTREVLRSTLVRDTDHPD
jgi:hypothetical protein